MLRKSLNILLFVVLFTTFALPISAWDEVGHKISAYIAWERMTPEVRKKVTEILLKAPEDSDLSVIYDRFNSRSEDVKGRELFMFASTWSDVIRNRDFKVRYEKYHKGDWHYADIFWKQENGKAEILKGFPEESGKAIPKLYEFENILKSETASAEEKAITLAWFLHVGGDIHNPLHNASRVTELEPKGDQGGNLFEFVPATEDNPFGLKLHWYWDSIISRNRPRKNDDCDADYLSPIARMIMKKHPYSKMKNRLDLGDYKDWNMEGFSLLNDVVYRDITRGKIPSAKYQRRAFKVGQEQIALAGYRLGETLNKIFSGKKEIAKIEKIEPGCRVIRKVLYPISKRRTPDQKMRIALLDICPPNKGMVARPMTTVFVDREPIMLEFDVIKVFENEAEAAKYASENGLKFLNFK